VPGDDSRRLLTYMWLIVAVSVPVVALTARQASSREQLSGLTSAEWLTIALLTSILVIGELWPIPVARGTDSSDEITVSSTFGFALLLFCPVFYAVAAQSLALLIDWVVRRRRWHRLPFNIGQYALAFVTARLVYAALSGENFTAAPGVSNPHLGAAMVAAVAFLVVNNGLTAIAVASKLELRTWRVLSEDLRWQIGTSTPLLALGPVVTHAAAWSPWALAILIAPVAALHRSGRLAMLREQEALRDSLTGLANRALFMASARRTLTASTRGAAVLMIDLDHFKDINDTLGHAVGDELLVAVAERLQAAVGHHDLVARLGGDEFAVLGRSLVDASSAAVVAERLGEGLRHPFAAGGVLLDVGCSIGISLAPDHGDSIEALMRAADVALYKAKAKRGTFAVYNPQDDTHSVALLGLQAELRRALEDEPPSQSGAITVAYQPQLNVADGQVAGVECLARWHHPVLGDLPPDVFIPIAESSTLIEALTRRVLESSLQQLSEWDAQGLHLVAAVNLSARMLSDRNLPASLADLLERHQIDPGRLVVEVTESRLMTDPERSAAVIREVHEVGVQISVDDFGTGYSSLAYLQRLQVDELKIDKTFVQEIACGGSETIVRSTIELGHNLGLRVVAEGVEDASTARKLSKMGCDRLQGYYIGRPCDAADLPASISAASARTAQGAATVIPSQFRAPRVVPPVEAGG
jgi:diguanylate cyclase (GGDEF)-like protein